MRENTTYTDYKQQILRSRVRLKKLSLKYEKAILLVAQTGRMESK